MSKFLRSIMLLCAFFSNTVCAMENPLKGETRRTALFAASWGMRAFSPVVKEFSDMITPLCRQGFNNPFLRSLVPGDVRYIHTNLEGIEAEGLRKVLRVFQSEKEAAEQSARTWRDRVAEQAWRIEGLKDIIKERDAAIKNLQEELRKAKGEIRLSPSEGGPSER